MKKIPIIILFFVLLSAATVFAIEPAPRITDREIIESLAEIKATQKTILQRFEQVDKRIDETNASNRMFHGFIISILIALFGYIIWDRRTLMKPLENKIINIERELDIGATDGNKIIRLINALRELSKEDEKVANVLRQFHLL